MANAGLVARSGRSAEAASARLVHLVLDGLRAEAATVGPKPPSPERMRLALRGNSTGLRLCAEPNDG